jgi:pimeloyl-ACP methyl ester carboxylesterase
MNADQKIAHAAADEVAGESGLLQRPHDADRVRIDPILVEMRLLSNVKHLENFHYQLSGNPSGKKLVFLHGLMGSAANWRRITPSFQADFHILTFDQRGHGRSFHPADGYQPKDFANDLKLILEDLGWDQAILVGHSMGGRNALEFAGHFAPRVKALVLEDIAPKSESVEGIEKLLDLVDTPFASRVEAKRFFDEEYPKRIAFNPQPKVVSQFFFTNIEKRADGRYDWRFAKEPIFAALNAARGEDRWDLYSQLKMPVLVVRGETSKDLPRPIFEKMLAVLPQAQGVEVKGAGHWVHFDQPEAFIGALKEFFDLKV